MKNDQSLFFGFILIGLGVLILLDRLNLLSINIFFDGWWTLFLIIPAIYLMYKNGIQTGNVAMLFIGAFFLLDEQGINLKGYLLPIVLVGIGLTVLFKRR